jgi:outer membrane protein TolC
MDRAWTTATRARLATLLLAASLIAAAAPAGAEETDALPFDLDAAIARGGRTLTAAEAVARALASAPRLDRARANLEAARAGAQATWIAFLPRVELTARYARIGGFEDGRISIGGGDVPVDQALALASTVEDPAARLLLTGMIEQQSSLTGVTIETPRDQAGFRAGLTVPLTDYFLTILPSYRAAEAQARLEEARLAAEEAEVAATAAETFYRYAQARGGLAVAEEGLQLAEEARDQVTALARAGLGSEADRLSAEARVEAARSGVARARAGEIVSRAALLSLVALPDDGEPLALAEPLTAPLEPPPQVTDELLRRAHSQRPEVRALRELVEAQDQVARATRAGHSPRVVLFAAGDYANPNQRVIPPEAEFTPSWEVGATLIWSPNDSIGATYRTRAARARRSAAAADLAALDDALRLQLLRAREDQVAALAVMAAATRRAEAALASREARLAELRSGQAVATELLEVELEVTRARLELLSAAVDLRVARARFDQALGVSPTPRPAR